MIESIIKTIALLLGIILGISLLIFGISVIQQRTIKTTCGIELSLNDALYYDLKAGGCPTVTIKESK